MSGVEKNTGSPMLFDESDPRIKELITNLAQQAFEKMIDNERRKWREEEDAKCKVEQEAKEREEEERRRSKNPYSTQEEMFEAFSNLLLDKLKNDKEKEATSSNGGGNKSDGGSFHKVPYKYSRDFVPGHSAPPIGKLPMLNEDNYDAWSDRMRSHLVSVHPSLWEIVNIGVYVPKMMKK